MAVQRFLQSAVVEIEAHFSDLKNSMLVNSLPLNIDEKSKPVMDILMELSIKDALHILDALERSVETESYVKLMGIPFNELNLSINDGEENKQGGEQVPTTESGDGKVL